MDGIATSDTIALSDKAIGEVAMTFQTIMNAVQTLSVREKQKLFQVLSIDLHQITALENASSLFWNPQPLATLLQQQRGLVLSNLRELAVDF